MVRLEQMLRIEKKKLDEMIEKCDGNLVNNFILEQSRRVDNLIVAYHKVKSHCIRYPANNIRKKVSSE